MSPEYLMPPSAMIGTPCLEASSAQSMTAVSCGTPTPATMRVVQIEPGPMPTLIDVGAGVDQRLGGLGGRHVAGDHLNAVRQLLDARHRLQHAARMPVRGVDDDQVAAGRHQQLGALEAVLADRRRGGDAQAPLGVLGGVRVLLRLLDVLDGDEADAAVARRRRRSASRCGWCAGAAWLPPATPTASTVISLSLVISSETGWSRLVAKRMSRLVRMPTRRPLSEPFLGVSTTGNAGDAVLGHDGQRLAQRWRPGGSSPD